MADGDIQAGGCPVSFRIVHQHSLQSIVKSDQPVLAVVLLRLLYGFGIDPMGRNFVGDLAVPVLNIVEYTSVNGACREHDGTFRYDGDGGKERTREWTGSG
jgi:hypothetical protein